MAAATGAEAWMITAPDDWHFLGTDRYPFSPHLRFFRREAFDEWETTMGRMRAALEERVAEAAARNAA